MGLHPVRRQRVPAALAPSWAATMGYLVLMVVASPAGWRSSRRCGSSASGPRASRRPRTSARAVPNPHGSCWRPRRTPRRTATRCSPTYPDRTVGATGRGRHRRHPERGRRGHLVPGRAARTRSWGWPRPTRPRSPARSSRSIRSTSRRPRTARPRWRWCSPTSPAAARCGPCRCTTTPAACPATPTCSWSASIILFLIHLPLLDRAEKKRKAFLTGGGAPAWYGPA